MPRPRVPFINKDVLALLLTLFLSAILLLTRTSPQIRQLKFQLSNIASTIAYPTKWYNAVFAFREENKLLKEYIKYFGDKPPFPPEHIMKTLVEMKKEDSFDDVMGKVLPEMDNIKKRIKDALGTDLDLESPLFDKDVANKKSTNDNKPKSFQN